MKQINSKLMIFELKVIYKFEIQLSSLLAVIFIINFWFYSFSGGKKTETEAKWCWCWNWMDVGCWMLDVDRSAHDPLKLSSKNFSIFDYIPAIMLVRRNLIFVFLCFMFIALIDLADFNEDLRVTNLITKPTLPLSASSSPSTGK